MGVLTLIIENQWYYLELSGKNLTREQSRLDHLDEFKKERKKNLTETLEKIKTQDSSEKRGSTYLMGVYNKNHNAADIRGIP